jgi:hypothetical protein
MSGTGQSGAPRCCLYLSIVCLAVWYPRFADAAFPNYRIVPLPLAMGGQGMAINRSGQITGSMFVSCQPQPTCSATHAFLFDPATGVASDLGTIGTSNSYGVALNDGGVVVGWLNNSAPQSAIVVSNGVMTLLPNFNASITSSAAWGINSAGVIVGGSLSPTSSPATLATVWANNVVSVIPRDANAAYAVNDYNQVSVGNGESSGIYNLDTGTFESIPCCTAYANNNAGQSAGGKAGGAYFNDYGAITTLPYLYAGTPAATVDGVAYGLNNAAQVVGYQQPTILAGEVGPHYAFIYAKGTIADLNTLVAGDPLASCVQLSEARGINDSGWVVANGTNNCSAPGLGAAYLLEPVTPYPAAVQLEVDPAAPAVGSAFTVYWTDQNVSTCTASGGSGADGWSGSVSTAGGQMQIKESSGGSFTFTLTCAGSSGSVTSSAMVMVSAQSGGGGSGGGGALDLLTFGALLTLLALPRWRFWPYLCRYARTAHRGRYRGCALPGQGAARERLHGRPRG